MYFIIYDCSGINENEKFPLKNKLLAFISCCQ